MTKPARKAAPQSTEPTPARAHYLALDGFRGLAILLVFLVHLDGAVSHLKDSWVGTVLILGASWGWMGVDMFFVLSGFLITGILIGSVNDRRYFRNFYIRRSLRIFPLFYGVFLLLLLLTPVLHFEWHPVHIIYLFYCQNIVTTFNGAAGVLRPFVDLGHFWSLAVEEQYYMIWPLIVWLLRDERKIMRLCLLLIGCSIVLRIALISLLPSNLALNFIYKELPTHWDGLLLGSWLALAMRRWPIGELQRRTRWLSWLAFVAVVGLAVYTHKTEYDTRGMEIVGLTALPFVFGGILLRCFVPGSLALRFFSIQPLRFLGRYSYGIYVYHVLFMPALVLGLHWLQTHTHSRVIAALAFVFLWSSSSIIVAVLSYKYFESPFLRLKERFAPSRDTQVVSV